MENEEFREQPEMEPADVLNVTEDNSAESDSGSQNDNFGEDRFGKFKTADALYEAYKNLQAEFTKKCQKLSEFEKDKTEESKPSQEELEDGLSSFLFENADAKNYSDELKKKVMSEEKDSPFENAWAKIFMETVASKDAQKYESPIFKKYVFDDEELKNKVIEIYMKDLNSNKPPILLSSDHGQQVTKLEPAAPNSLKEAKKLVEDMFS